MTQITQNIKAIILALLIVLGMSYVQAAGVWTSAPANPPSGNVDAPLNVGNDGQHKEGGLTLNTRGAPNGLIVTAGKVGFGTINPTAQLEVLGAPKVNPITLNSLGVANDADRALNFNVDNSNYGKITIPAGSGGAMSFWTGGANDAVERVRITNTGNVGIGTVVPGTKLEVVGGSIKATSGLIIETRTTNPTSPETGRMWLRTDL